MRTRNARLAAIRSFFRFAALRHPEHADHIARVLAIPTKRCERAVVCYLTEPEADAVVASPDTGTWNGRRDHAILVLALQTGLRVSELTGLRNQDVHLGAGRHVRCWGKGRKERHTPLRPGTESVLRNWMRERAGRPDDPLFPTRQGTPLTRAAIEALVAKHAATAIERQPSLRAKKVTPHVLRHSCAMALLRGGVDRTVLALWLGHEQVDTHRDVRTRRPLDQRASARPHQTTARPTRALPRLPTGSRLPPKPLIMRNEAAPPTAPIRPNPPSLG